MPLSPVIAVHLTSALSALSIGPFVLWARHGAIARPRLHRALGYAWVTLMGLTTLSACFIRDFLLPNVMGFSAIHLFVPLAVHGLWRGLSAVYQQDIDQHRRHMQRLYWLACVGAGMFTLLPGRYLGHRLWHDTLGWI